MNQEQKLINEILLFLNPVLKAITGPTPLISIYTLINDSQPVNLSFSDLEKSGLFDNLSFDSKTVNQFSFSEKEELLNQVINFINQVISEMGNLISFR
ncbi:MAG: hypothetical protein AAF927_03830, partial [Bacteroidota bacterium]